MNDQLLMENMLLLLKSNMEVYVHGSLESSADAVYKTLKYGLDETLKLQHSLYNKMASYGWYQIQTIDKSVIETTLNKLEK